MPDSLLASHHPDCYPSGRAEALRFFREALEKFPAPKEAITDRPLVGIVTPHIDFRVSLQAYAAAFHPLMKQPDADAYVILGVGHRSQLEWNLDRRDYATPLGRAVCAPALVEKLSRGDPKLFEAAGHDGEHSIEFPLMWLQALRQLRGGTEPVYFVPLLCGGLHEYIAGVCEWEDLHEFHALATALRGVLTGSEKIQVIVSIDGCHLGPRFQHRFRVTPERLRHVERWEGELWQQVARGDARTLLEWIRGEGNDGYFDGVGALALLLHAGAGKFHVHRHFYEQWFTQRDASAVTFSSGSITR